MFSSQTLLQGSVDVVGVELNARWVLLDTRNWAYLDMNETGSFIWNCLQEPLTLGALNAKLTEAFDVDPAACSAQVESFLNDLAQRAFITVGADRSAVT